MAVVSTLAVDLTLRSASFTRGLRSAQNQLTGFVAFTTKVNRSLGRLGALLGIGAAGGLVAGFGKLITAGIRWGDTLDDMSKRTGIAIKDLTALERLAATSGVGFDTLASSIQIMQRSISRASSGDRSLGALFRSIRLDVEGLKRLNAFAAFVRIADALSRIRNEADRLRAIQMIFGRGGGMLAGVIAGGSGELAKAAADVERFSLSLDTLDAAKLAETADALNLLATSWKRLAAELAIRSNLAMNVTMMAAAISQLAKSLKESREAGPIDMRRLPSRAIEIGEPLRRRFANPFGWRIDEHLQRVKSLTSPASSAEQRLFETSQFRNQVSDVLRAGMRHLEDFITAWPDLATTLAENIRQFRLKLGEVDGSDSIIPKFPTSRAADVKGSIIGRSSSELGLSAFGNMPRAARMPLLFKENRIEEQQLEVLKDMLEKLRDIDDGLDDTGLTDN